MLRGTHGLDRDKQFWNIIILEALALIGEQELYYQFSVIGSSRSPVGIPSSPTTTLYFLETDARLTDYEVP